MAWKLVMELNSDMHYNISVLDDQLADRSNVLGLIDEHKLCQAAKLACKLFEVTTCSSLAPLATNAGYEFTCYYRIGSVNQAARLVHGVALGPLASSFRDFIDAMQCTARAVKNSRQTVDKENHDGALSRVFELPKLYRIFLERISQRLDKNVIASDNARGGPSFW
jgi:hypothetical protein